MNRKEYKRIQNQYHESWIWTEKEYKEMKTSVIKIVDMNEKNK